MAVGLKYSNIIWFMNDVNDMSFVSGKLNFHSIYNQNTMNDWNNKNTINQKFGNNSKN